MQIHVQYIESWVLSYTYGLYVQTLRKFKDDSLYYCALSRVCIHVRIVFYFMYLTSKNVNISYCLPSLIYLQTYLAACLGKVL